MGTCRPLRLLTISPRVSLPNSIDGIISARSPVGQKIIRHPPQTGAPNHLHRHPPVHLRRQPHSRHAHQVPCPSQYATGHDQSTKFVPISSIVELHACRIDLDTQITPTFNAADVPNMVGVATRQELQTMLAQDARKVERSGLVEKRTDDFCCGSWFSKGSSGYRVQLGISNNPIFL